MFGLCVTRIGAPWSVESLAASSCTREARALVRVGTAVLVVRGVTTGILYRFEFTHLAID